MVIGDGLKAEAGAVEINDKGAAATVAIDGGGVGVNVVSVEPVPEAAASANAIAALFICLSTVMIFFR